MSQPEIGLGKDCVIFVGKTTFCAVTKEVTLQSCAALAAHAGYSSKPNKKSPHVLMAVFVVRIQIMLRRKPVFIMSEVFMVLCMKTIALGAVATLK